MKKIFFAILVWFMMIFSCGCASSVAITTAHVWEKRYSQDDVIMVNDQKIDTSNCDVWILSSKTLNNLLTIEGHKVIDIR